MTISLALCLAWVLGAAVTAMLPAERQYGPGFVLLLAAPLILTATGLQHGAYGVGAATLVAASMFRNPLVYLTRWSGRRRTGPVSSGQAG